MFRQNKKSGSPVKKRDRPAAIPCNLRKAAHTAGVLIIIFYFPGETGDRTGKHSLSGRRALFGGVFLKKREQDPVENTVCRTMAIYSTDTENCQCSVRVILCF
jgi:hypothetical protein